MQANVLITSPTGGNNVPADKALNSTNGTAFTLLGNIVITEGAAADIAVGNSQTLVLTVPPGWQFKAGVGTVSFTGSRDITAATISVTASTATVSFNVSGVSKLDVLTIGGLQVQALDGANLAAADYIRNVFDNPGTAVIAGIEQDFTTFGLLNQVVGAARALAIADPRLSRNSTPGADSAGGSWVRTNCGPCQAPPKAPSISSSPRLGSSPPQVRHPTRSAPTRSGSSEAPTSSLPMNRVSQDMSPPGPAMKPSSDIVAE